MKNLVFSVVLLIALYGSNPINGQHLLYLLEDHPTIFYEVEQQFIEEEYDSVAVLLDNILRNEADPTLHGIVYFYKGQLGAVRNRIELAHDFYDKASNLFLSSNYNKGLVMVFALKGNLYAQQEKITEAIPFYNLSLQYSTEQKVEGVLIDIYQKKAEFYYSIEKSDSAFLYLRKALHTANIIKANDSQIALLNQISTNYHSLGKLDSAIFYFEKSLHIKQLFEDHDGLISDHSAIGKLYRERGDYENAQRHLMEAMNIAEIELDSFSMSTISSEIGDIYAAQNLWDIAESYYNNSIQIAQLKNSHFMEANCFKKIGDILYYQRRDSASIINYESALEIYTRLNSKINIAEVLTQLSRLYKSKENLIKAKKLLQESLKSSDNSQDIISSLKTKMALANINVKLGNISSGIILAEGCKDSFIKMGDKENLRKVSLLLSEAYSQKGNFQKAFQNHKKYSALKDSLTSVEKAEAINKYDLLVTTKKKDDEIAVQNEKIQTQKVDLLRKNNQLILLTGGLGFSALIASLLFFVYYKNKQLNEQRIQVLKKNQEAQIMKSIIEGEEKERKRFSKELHDGLGAVLATVKMQINGIPQKFPEVVSSKTYQKAELLIDNACRTVREISHDLMPYVLEEQGLFSAIEEMCNNLTSQNDTKFDFIRFGDDLKVSNVTNITLYRITQELLKNAIKHSHATEVLVQLTIEDDEIILIVEDNGKGFTPSSNQNGIGMKNIKSRAEYLNGSFEIESSLELGSTFTIILPNQGKNQ